MRELAVRALDVDVAIATDDDALFAAVSTLTAAYERARGPARVRYQLELARGAISRDGLTAAAAPTRLAQLLWFEQDLYASIVERAPRSFLVHGAALARDGAAIVLFGASGAGKTTLSRALVARGARYITDEFVSVDSALAVRGVPRPLYLDPRERSPDPLADATELGERAVYWVEDRAGAPVEIASLSLDERHLCREPVRAAAIVHLRHAPTEPEGARALSPSEALTRLWDERHRTGRDELELAIALLRDVPAYELCTRTVEGACRDLARIGGSAWYGAAP